MTKFETLEAKVIEWAKARDIIQNSTALAQVKKAQEEMGELLIAAGQVEVLRQFLKPEADTQIDAAHLKALAEFDDAVGDVLVCLVNACAIAGTDVASCLEHAYHQIKDRKGKLLPNGIFQKEQG